MILNDFHDVLNALDELEKKVRQIESCDLEKLPALLEDFKRNAKELQASMSELRPKIAVILDDPQNHNEESGQDE